MNETKFVKPLGTTLNRISNLSCQNAKAEFKWLMPHATAINLTSCFNELDGRKAVGVDGQTKDDYARALNTNISNLIERMKDMSYRPGPVRQVHIPKGDGKFRSLGISNIEDKVVQSMFAKLLESIYEPIFCDCSYGFRRGISAHKAIKDTIRHLKFNNVKQVIDIDLENYFGTIKHDQLLEMLSLKIKDRVFLRYIARMLKAGVMTDHGVEHSDVGLPQGSILSPVLANIYAHYIIDLWFDKVVPKHIIGKVAIFRYCDDAVICCTDTRDTEKIINALGKRLSKFGLKLNRDKTTVVNFNRYTYERGVKQGTFDFLSFTFYLARARKGGFVTVKVKTSKKALRAKLGNVKTWVRLNRFKGTLLAVWTEFRRKLRGHIAYFGVSDNGASVKTFIHAARRIFFKWMNRRSQRRSINWEKFEQFEKQFPTPKVIIYHRMF